MDIQTHRKLRLRELIDHSCSGLIAVMAAKIDKADTYVSRMLYPVDKKGAKPVGDKMMLLIEAAFGLERAWFDMPLGSALPGQASSPVAEYAPTYPHASDLGSSPRMRAEGITWPFRLVSYRRLKALRQALGPKHGGEAIRDIDKQLEIVTLKWEREAEVIGKRRAA